MADQGATTAFVVAHPGHELRLATWIARTRPLVFILAKGARAGRSETRIQASRLLVEALGATPSDLFGVAFDSEIYGWIMNRDVKVFSALADDLREAFVARRVEFVVTDAWQNYNPVHDLTHALARVAAAEASALTGRPVEVMDYPVVMGRLAHAPLGSEHSHIEQSSQDLAAKARLIDDYPDVADDVRALDDAVGREAVSRETLHRPLNLETLRGPLDEAPWYERHGEERVRAGVYSDVLRWSHMAPIVAMLADRLSAAESRSGSAVLPALSPIAPL
ncbi:hypothetical protein [Caulobacter sp. BK020]|uniref:hypothetical protein n=1 Tax=Caulobacter sp. BK020 TaxID=2512117 RepID=UPI00104A1A47|nr:hypothetical protein [Caulobacter sp. BK020]